MSATMTKDRFTRGTPAAKMADPGQRPATSRQIDFLVDLVKQIGAYDAERGTELWMDMRARQAAGLTFAEASGKIDDFKAFRNELRAAKVTESVAPKLPLLVPEGRYAVDTDEGHLAFYRVKVDKEGVVSVLLQTSDELRALPLKTALGVMTKIEATGIEVAMTRYGKELRICGAPMCGRTLTNEDSRKRGIGPVCNDKMGF
jgi:hypothetical protein